MTIIKNLRSLCVFCFIILLTTNSYSQTVEDINAMPSQDVQSLVSKAKASGYTPEQLRALAASKGLSPEQVNALAGKMQGAQDVNNNSQDFLTIRKDTTDVNQKKMDL
jgi:hypothetical protein